MRNFRSIHLYADVAEILDQVLASEGDAHMDFASANEATVWRHRANKFRLALRVNDEIRNGIAEGEGTCIYDTLWFKAEGPRVWIKHRKIEGKLTLLSGPGEALNFEDFDLEKGLDQ